MSSSFKLDVLELLNVLCNLAALSLQVPFLALTVSCLSRRKHPHARVHAVLIDDLGIGSTLARLNGISYAQDAPQARERARRCPG